MKLLYRISNIVGLIFLFILATLCIKVLNLNVSQIDKTSIIIQGIYAFVTTILVMLTFSVLIVSKKQNYQSVKPDLTIGEIDLINDRRNELDFEIFNIGKDKAFNIVVKLFKNNDKRAFFEQSYPRLNTVPSELRYPLYEIVNAIRELKREITGKVNGIGNHIIEEISIDEEIELPSHFSDFYKIKFLIQFEDIYSNQYINTFIFNYDEDEDEYFLIKETSRENSNIISEIKNLFR